MVLMVTWPTLTDDSGTGQDGTPVDHTFELAVKTSIEDQVHSLVNTTIKPKTITDEVVTARGNEASLNARIATVIDSDGALIIPATVALIADVKQLLRRNHIPNSDFLLWSAGDSAAPNYWTLSGTGAAIARTGLGLGDTYSGGYGDFACKITYGSQEAKLTHNIISTTSMARATAFRSKWVTVGVKCKTATASIASIVVDDGVTTTRGGASGNGTYHTGGNTTEWLYCTHQLSASATKISVYLSVAGSGNAYFGDVMLDFSNYAVLDFAPCPMQKGLYHFGSSGVLTTGTLKSKVCPGAPGIITDVQLLVDVAPVGASLIVDVNTFNDSSVYTTAFTTKPTITAGLFAGNAVPDGTYARRCLSMGAGSSFSGGGAISFDIDQVGSGTPGSELVVEVRVRQYLRELESLLEYSQV
jgi:hypothetical protein